MLDHAAVREMVIAAGLCEHVEQIVAAVRPGWVLELDRNADPSDPGVSKIGGDPDLADDESWPMSPAGGAYTFLAQIDCSRLPTLPEMWPDPHPWDHGNALLRLFADLRGSPGEPCAAAALSAPGARSFARAARPTSSYDDPERGSQDERRPECVVVARPFLSVPEVLPGLRAAV